MNCEHLASRDYYIICEQSLPSSGSAEPAEADLAQWYGWGEDGHWVLGLQAERSHAKVILEEDKMANQNGGWPPGISDLN